MSFDMSPRQEVVSYDSLEGDESAVLGVELGDAELLDDSFEHGHTAEMSEGGAAEYAGAIEDDYEAQATADMTPTDFFKLSVEEYKNLSSGLELRYETIRDSLDQDQQDRLALLVKSANLGAWDETTELYDLEGGHLDSVGSVQSLLDNEADPDTRALMSEALNHKRLEEARMQLRWGDQARYESLMSGIANKDVQTTAASVSEGMFVSGDVRPVHEAIIVGAYRRQDASSESPVAHMTDLLQKERLQKIQTQLEVERIAVAEQQRQDARVQELLPDARRIVEHAASADRQLSWIADEKNIESTAQLMFDIEDMRAQYARENKGEKIADRRLFVHYKREDELHSQDPAHKSHALFSLFMALWGKDFKNGRVPF